MADVHIISVSEDEARAKTLAAMFEAGGFSVALTAPDNSQLGSVGAGVIVWSQASSRSPPFLDAAKRLIDADKAVVVGLVEPAWQPSNYFSRNAPTFDISNWTGDKDDPALDPVFFAVDRMVNSMRATTTAATPFGKAPLPSQLPIQAPLQPAAGSQGPRGAPSSEAELWRSIRDSRHPEVFMDYLARYGPSGAFAEIAELRLRALTAPSSAATPAPAPKPTITPAKTPPAPVAKPAPPQVANLPPPSAVKPPPAAVPKPAPAAPIKPAAKLERHVFLSHASDADGKRAMKLLTALEAAGCRCWIAPRDIPAGADWNQSILTAVENSAALLLLLSSAAAKSAFVQAEVHRAFDKRIRVVQVLLSANIDPAPIDMRLLRVQRISASGDDKALAQRILAAIN